MFRLFLWVNFCVALLHFDVVWCVMLCLVVFCVVFLHLLVCCVVLCFVCLCFVLCCTFEGGNSNALSNVPELQVVYGTNDANKCAAVKRGNPFFRVSTVRDGTAAYTYAVHFVGLLFSNVEALTIAAEGPDHCNFQQNAGSVRDASVRTRQQGGSKESYRVDISNEMVAPITGGEVTFSITIDGAVVQSSACATWNDLADITTKINAGLAYPVAVSKLGSSTLYANSLATYDESLGSYGFSYEFTFSHVAYSGGIGGFTATTDGCTALVAEKGIPAIRITKTADGSSPVNEIVLSEGFQSVDEVTGTYQAYKVPPVFSVLDDASDVSKLLIFDNSGPFTATFAISDGISKTGTLNWDAQDHTVEQELRDLVNNPSIRITVTRHADAVLAPNGFVHTIYCDTKGVLTGLSIADETGSSDISLTTENNAVVCAAADPTKCQFTAVNVPLGRLTDSSTSATYLGKTESLLPIYRVSGFGWDVKFETNLGDVSNLVLGKSRLQGEDAAASGSVVSELFPGTMPAFTLVSDLEEGIKYYFRARIVTSEGLSEPSLVASGIAISNPEGVHHVAVGNALHVDEVQTITVAATRVRQDSNLLSSPSPFHLHLLSISSPSPLRSYPLLSYPIPSHLILFSPLLSSSPLLFAM
jgi:hypothetical protein